MSDPFEAEGLELLELDLVAVDEARSDHHWL